MRIVFHSFEGRYSDSPRAVFEALRSRGAATEHVWLAKPGQAGEFPADVRVLEFGSAEGLEALEACDALVANTHTDLEWSKPPGALYLQTWHGTPLKRIHRDVLWAPDGRLDRLQRDVDRWDVLVSPNHPSTPLLRRAFHFDGEVLETGYPRNDVLLGPDREAIRARVRRELGIAEGQTAVLYTPTWRDDMVFEEGGRAFALELDPAGFADALGPGVVLLLRLHRMDGARAAAREHPRVLDVSGRPEVGELYLAADTMVTDYSSTMFDFALTGKPMLLYAYDLEDFRDRLRGFYFDLEAEAPGPLVRTAGELAEALLDLEGVARDSEERLARFRERFCHLEDGRSADRVAARVLAGRQGPAAPAVADRSANG